MFKTALTTAVLIFAVNCSMAAAPHKTVGEDGKAAPEPTPCDVWKLANPYQGPCPAPLQEKPKPPPKKTGEQPSIDTVK